MAAVWQTGPEGRGAGKYLVVRRDGTIPAWNSFVIAAVDPCAAAALRAYADEAERLGLAEDYVASIREQLAPTFAQAAAEAAEAAAQGRVEKGPDPDAPPHRTDNPAVVAMMCGIGDLTGRSTSDKPASDQQWAIVELMGHVVIGGIVSEDTSYGVTRMRCDALQHDGAFITQFVGGAAIYRETRCSEAVVRARFIRQQAPVRQLSYDENLDTDVDDDDLPI